MSETTAVEIVNAGSESNPFPVEIAAPKAAPAKKPAPKPKATPSPAPKKPAAKPIPKAKGETKPSEKAKPSTNGHAKAGGLRGPQVRILTALAKSNKPMTRAQIAEKAKVDQAFCTTWIGSLDVAKRTANENKRGVTSLLTLKMLRADPDDEAGTTYVITAAGRAAAQKAQRTA